MGLKYLQWLVPAVVIICSAAGCEGKLTPVEVTAQFWNGVEQRDVTAIRKFISADSRVDSSVMDTMLPIRDASFGKTVIEADQARVDTTVTVVSDSPFALPLTTMLVMENGSWKVNFDKTIAPISSGSDIAAIVQGIHRLGEQFMGDLDKSMGEIQREIPEIKREIDKAEEKFKSSIPELKRRMEEFTRQLEEALKRPPESAPPEPPQEQKGTIAI